MPATRKSAKKLRDYFCELEDPRVERTKKHDLMDLIVMGICSVLTGGDSFEDMHQFAEERRDWLRSIIPMKGGVPSADTFERVFARINPKRFGSCLQAWTSDLQKLTKGSIVAIDGKSIRNSFDTASSKNAIHMVSAWSCANDGLCLGQLKVAGKSNEITAIPELVKMLDLKGAIVTIDAIGCQTEIANDILEAKADYCLAVKGNQKGLHEEIRHFFDEVILDESMSFVPCGSHTTDERKRGRQEKREYWTSSEIDWMTSKAKWPGLKSIGMVQSTREVKGKTSIERRYYICSFQADAKKFAAAVRSHWRVENSLHWTMDVVFNEDDSRIRKDNSPENVAALRRMATNLLKQETTKKSSLKQKIRTCCMKTDYLLKVLLGH